MQILQCPSEPNAGITWPPSSSQWTDYFYNDSVGVQVTGGLSLAELEAPTLTIMNGDSRSSHAANHTSGNANNNGGGIAQMRDDWDPNVGGMRHLEGGNYSFTDGHVKWLKPTQVTRDATGSGNFTFRHSNCTTAGC